ncbi:uncharacterized protein LOC141897040 [Acropora palmata]|uniref:uncharacterized protein LOC141897040 n=1 Tax=Acropora palmata TaxID=6131 RepID=UPI003DA1A630
MLNSPKTHVTGVLCHGHNLAWPFIDLLRWPADTSPTINILLTVLRDIVLQVGSLLQVFYWQMDNCFQDCKKIYILGFCAFLVMAGVFKKVKLSYLLAGHTHEDVDQMFSRISESLKKEDATTCKALRILINKSYSPYPSTVYVDNISDMKSWIQPYVSTFQHHGSRHVFCHTKNVKG